MIEETKTYIAQIQNIKKIGLLATLGTYQSMVYQQVFSANNDPEIITPNKEQKEKVHEAIYNKTFGIKAFSNPVTQKATSQLKEISTILKKNGAQTIIMGCTEIPLALKEKDMDLPLIDPTNVLARALINKADKTKLKK
jgi:aspartate racemase